MYSLQEESVLRKQFWTSFGQYLAPIPSVEGNKINWINYKTGIRFIQFRMDATRDQAYIAIEISHKDPAMQELYFSHFKLLKTDLENTLGENWVWEQNRIIEGKTISRIYSSMDTVNIYRQSDWPQMISFLKERIILLDDFWSRYKDIFEMLA